MLGAGAFVVEVEEGVGAMLGAGAFVVGMEEGDAGVIEVAAGGPSRGGESSPISSSRRSKAWS